MANETELDRLVVRLVGDGDDYTRMMEEALSLNGELGSAISRSEQFMLSAAAAADNYSNFVDEMRQTLAHGTISQEDFNAAVTAGGQITQEVIASISSDMAAYQAVMREGEAVSKSLMTSEERHAERVDNLSRLLSEGAISHETFTRGLIQAETAYARVNPLMQQGEQVTRSLMTAEERYAEETQQLSIMLREGAISHETFTRGMIQAQERLDAATPAVEGLGQSLQTAGTALTAFGAAWTAAFGATAYYAVDQFNQEEQAVLKLSAAYEAHGKNVEKEMERSRAFADVLEDVGNKDDALTMSLLQSAESLGLNAEQAERAVRNAYALSDAENVHVKAAIRATAALEQGKTMLVAQYIPALRGMEEGTERSAKAQEMLGHMFGITEQKTQSFQGQLDRMNNVMDDFWKGIGTGIVKIIRPFINTIAEWAEMLEQSSEWVKTAAAGALILAVGLGAAATAAGGAILTTGALISSYGALTAAMASNATVAAIWGAAINLALGPVGAITVAAIAAAGALLYLQGVEEERIATELANSKKASEEGWKRVDEVRRQADMERLARGELPKFFKQEELEPVAPDEILKNIDELAKKYAEQTATLGMTAAQVRQYEIEKFRALGVNEKFLESLKLEDAALQRAEQVAERAKQAQEKLNEEKARAKQLTEEARTPFEKYSDQVAELDALLKKNLITLQTYNEMRRKYDEQLKQGSKSEDQKKAEELVSRFATPMEKFRKQVSELQRLRDSNLLDQGTFDRGLQAAKDEFDQLTKDKEVKIKINFQGIDAAAAGSMEALARIAEFESLKGGKAELGAIELAEQAGLDMRPLAEQENQRRGPMARQRRPPLGAGSTGLTDAPVTGSQMVAALNRLVQIEEEKLRTGAVEVMPLGIG